MLLCSAEKCGQCQLIEGSPDCLRRQAHNCVVISKKVFRRGVRDTLEELSLELMDRARTVEHEQTLPPAPHDFTREN